MQIRLTVKQWRASEYASVDVIIEGDRELAERIKAKIEEDEDIRVE